MADLGQLIGALLAGVAHARRIADEETAAIAEYYKDDPLLSSMSVPRVRIPELSLELPVLIMNYSEAQAPKLREVVSIISAIEEVLQNKLGSIKAQQRRQIVDKFKSNLEGELNRLRQIEERGPEFLRQNVALAVNHAFIEATKTSGAAPLLPQSQLTAISRDLQQVAREVVYEQMGVPPRIEASIITADVKNASSPNNVTRLRLMVREEGLDWDTVEQSDGSIRSSLSPE